MSKLRGLRCYLSGPMQFCPDGGTSWRERVTKFLEARGVIVYDPTQMAPPNGISQAEFPEAAQAYVEAGDWEGLRELGKPMRAFDLKLVDKSDFLVVCYDPKIQTCGTWEEVFWANRLKRPILLFCTAGKANIPWWMFWTLPHKYLHDRLSDVLHRLDRLNHGDEEMDERWVIIPEKETVS